MKFKKNLTKTYFDNDKSSKSHISQKSLIKERSGGAFLSTKKIKMNGKTGYYLKFIITTSLLLQSLSVYHSLLKVSVLLSFLC